jgi:hypothetical protein
VALLLALLVLIAWLLRPSLASAQDSLPDTLAFLRDSDVWLVDVDGDDPRPLSLDRVAAFEWISRTELRVLRQGDGGPQVLLVGLNGDVRSPGWMRWGDMPAAEGRLYVRAPGFASLFEPQTAEDQQVVVFDRAGREVARVRVVPQGAGRLVDCGEAALDQDRARLAFGIPALTPDEVDVVIPVYCAAVNASGEPSLPAGPNFGGALYVVPIVAGRAPAMPLPLEVNVGFSGLPRFAPDGRYLAIDDWERASCCEYVSRLHVLDLSGRGGPGRELVPAAMAALRDPTERDHTSGIPEGDPGDGRPEPAGIDERINGYDWSPDGTTLVASFSASWLREAAPSEPASEGLYLLARDGSTEALLMEGPARDPAWSPSGQFIAYACDPPPDASASPPEPPIIRVIDLSGDRTVTMGPGSHPAGSPSSSALRRG